MEREEGYYWTKAKFDDEWNISYYYGIGIWGIIDNTGNRYDYDFDEIDENRIKRT